MKHHTHMTSKSIEQRVKQKKNWLDAPAKLKKAGLIPLTGVDPKQTIENLQAILDENARLSNLRGRYVEHAGSVMELAANADALAAGLRALAKDIDPVLTLPKTRTHRAPATQIAGELLEKMRVGTQVTTDLIAATYPALSQAQVWALLRRLTAAPGVVRMKDRNNKVRLFNKREG